jgi:hypothetical protein
MREFAVRRVQARRDLYPGGNHDSAQRRHALHREIKAVAGLHDRDFGKTLNGMSARWSTIRRLPVALSESIQVSKGAVSELRRQIVYAQEKRSAERTPAGCCSGEIGRSGPASPERALAGHGWIERYWAAASGVVATSTAADAFFVATLRGARAFLAGAAALRARTPFADDSAPRARAVFVAAFFATAVFASAFFAARFAGAFSAGADFTSAAFVFAPASMRNFERSFAPLIQAGARPRPLHVAPVFGSAYFGLTG